MSCQLFFIIYKYFVIYSNSTVSSRIWLLDDLEDTFSKRGLLEDIEDLEDFVDTLVFT